MEGYSDNGHVAFEPNYKYITGYHGTSHESAESILSHDEFKISVTDENWLGSGIYFYKYYVDAAKWKGVKEDSKPAEEVIHVVVKVGYDEHVDLESKDGETLYNAYRERAIKDKIKVGTPQENQCKLVNMIWEENPDIKVISGAFPVIPRSKDFATLMDTRSKRREFCIRNNDNILLMNRIKGTEV